MSCLVCHDQQTSDVEQAVRALLSCIGGARPQPTGPPAAVPTAGPVPTVPTGPLQIVPGTGSGSPSGVNQRPATVQQEMQRLVGELVFFRGISMLIFGD